MGLCLFFQLIGLCCDSKMDFVKVQPAGKPSIAPPRTPASLHGENTLTEKGICLLFEVWFDIKAWITMLYYVLILCCLFLRSTLARALYAIRSTVKFVSSVIWNNHNLIMSLEIRSFYKKDFWWLCFLRSFLFFCWKQILNQNKNYRSVLPEFWHLDCTLFRGLFGVAEESSVSVQLMGILF